MNANTGAITELFKPGGPCITSLGPSSELLLAKGNVGIFLGSDGRISRKASLTWSDAPVATTHSHPYAVALLPNYVEIRSVQRVSANGLAQVDQLLPFCNSRRAPSSLLFVWVAMKPLTHSWGANLCWSHVQSRFGATTVCSW